MSSVSSQSKSSNISLFIFRRDFRIKDNTGLIKALSGSEQVIPIFIFTPEQIKTNPYKSDNAVQFMIESLLELKQNLKHLTFYYGDYLKVIDSLVKESKINNIYTNTDYTPYAIKRDNDIAKYCKKNNIEFHPSHDILLFEPTSLLNLSGEYYQKYTPFYRKAISEVKKINPVSKSSESTLLKKAKLTKIKNNKYLINKKELGKFYKHNPVLNINGGRSNALKVLSSLKEFKKYDDERNLLNIETTHLSGYLKFGCLSIREVFFQLKKLFGLSNGLIKQLIWREFYYHLGFGKTERFGKSLKEQYDKIKWKKNAKHLEAWKEGRTGFPVVDAAMTQLNTKGYMHNRGRLLTASFLIKNLGIDWREGEKYFAQKLLDYDVLVNNGNWQWVSGSGADSQPYFRVFNPTLQSTKFDVDCEYIKKWLPNLKDIPAKHLHNWNDFYKEYNLADINYVKPIVDYKESKASALALYKTALK